MACLRTLIPLLACLTLAPQAVRAEPATHNPEAKRHYDAGLAYIDDPGGSKWDEALREFRAAFRSSGQWKLQNNIGLCALNLERDEEAIEAYRDYLTRSGNDLPADKRKQIERDVAMLSAGLVRLEIAVELPEATLLDERRTAKGETIANRYPIRGGKGSLGIHPGHHRVTIEAAGYQSDEWVFEAEPASHHQHQFALTKRETPASSRPMQQPASSQAAPAAATALQPSERHTPTMVTVGLVTTGVFAVAATATGIVAMNKAKDFDNSSDQTEGDKIAKSGRTFTLLTDIGIGAAIVSAGATAYFYFSAPKEPVTVRPPAARLRVLPVASTNTAGIALYGTL